MPSVLRSLCGGTSGGCLGGGCGGESRDATSSLPLSRQYGVDQDFNDTLMHVSGNLLRDDVGEQVKPFKSIHYLAPGIRSE